MKQKMKTILELCEVRDSIFNSNIDDDVLSINDINNTNNRDKLNTPEKALSFFEENYLTKGMKELFDSAFARFHKEEGSTNIIKLTQSMGGGKTHNMTALGLLAKYPEIRDSILGKEYKYKNYREIKVVTINGRNVDMEYGIWGEIAKQLRNESFFNKYYSPLRAPGQDTWVRFFKETLNGEPLLILLDELPPYLDNAESISIGESNLARVTTTALTNLFVATGDTNISNIFIVLSDLKASYNNGSELLKVSLGESTYNLDNESKRYAKDIQPISSNSNDIYEILRKRLFKKLPEEAEINKIKDKYFELVKNAKDAGYTALYPQKMNDIINSYPFHPCFKGITTTFRDNAGFQQTRDLLRLMRKVVVDMYNSGKLNETYLINFTDINFQNSEIIEQVKSINSTLENAISQDIYNGGSSTAEYSDLKLDNKNNITQSLAKLIFFASLSDNVNEKKGLSKSELIGYMVSPNVYIEECIQSLEYLRNNAWYIHELKDGTILFKDIENLIAKVNRNTKTITTPEKIKYLKKMIEKEFKPTVKDCYQKLLILPDTNEPIELKDEQGNPLGDKKNTILIIIYGIELEQCEKSMNELFNAEFCYKNRIIFLVGTKNTLNYTIETLLTIATKLKSIDMVSSIYNEGNKEITNAQEEQLVKLNELKNRENRKFKESISKIFRRVYYPRNKLKVVDIDLEDVNNCETKIKEVLAKSKKFIESSDFKDSKYSEVMFNSRIFTQESMSWSDIEHRTATNPEWILHHPRELENLKTEMINKDIWREIDGRICKGPFYDKTNVIIKVKHQDNDTGETTLELIPENGDEIQMKKFGQPDSSFITIDNYTIKTKESALLFRCIDNTSNHETGDNKYWQNKILLKYEINNNQIIIKAIPGGDIIYSINGDSLISNSIKYTKPIEITPEYNLIHAKAIFNQVESEIVEIKNLYKIDDVKINASKPVKYKKKRSLSKVSDIYSELNALKKANASISSVEIQLSKEDDLNYDSISEILINKEDIAPVQIEKLIDYIKVNLLDETYNTVLEIGITHFKTGAEFKEYLNNKNILETELNVLDIEQ